MVPQWLSPGTGVQTKAVIMKASHNVRFQNPSKMLTASLPIGTFGRIYSQERDKYVVWFLDDVSSSTIMIEVPTHMVGQLMQPYQHKIFPHFAK